MSIFLRHRYENVSGFCTGTDTSSLHKMAVWSDELMNSRYIIVYNKVTVSLSLICF